MLWAEGAFSNQPKLKTMEEYRGIRQALNQGLATLVEPIRNTNIKINRTRDKKDPGLLIEVTTEQYYAVATVHLLPNKNR